VALKHKLTAYIVRFNTFRELKFVKSRHEDVTRSCPCIQW